MRINRRNKDVKNTLGRFHACCWVRVSSKSIGVRARLPCVGSRAAAVRCGAGAQGDGWAAPTKRGVTTRKARAKQAVGGIRGCVSRGGACGAGACLLLRRVVDIHAGLRRRVATREWRRARCAVWWGAVVCACAGAVPHVV
jgi:hypothetical protein